MMPHLMLALFACLDTSQPEASLAGGQAPAPPTVLWRLDFQPWGSLLPTSVTGPDGALYTTDVGWTLNRHTALSRATTDPSTGELTWSAFGSEWAGLSYALTLGDGDADGDIDFLTVDTDSTGTWVQVRDVSTGAVVRSVPLPFIRQHDARGELSLLQVDGDPLPEVLLAGRHEAWVVDDDGTVLASLVDTCEAGGPFLLTDGPAPEILTCTGELRDGATLTLSSVIAVTQVLDAVAVDVDADGDRDLVVREGLDWVLLDGHTGLERWRIALPDSTGTPLMYDLDGDGTTDLVFPAGDESDTLSVLAAIDPTTGIPQRSIRPPRPAFHAQALTTWDHDGDGIPALVVGGYGTALYEAGRGWGGLGPILRDALPVVADLTPHPGVEVAFVSPEPYDTGTAEVGVYDLAGARLGMAALPVLSAPGGSLGPLEPPLAGDLDGDGDAELVINESQLSTTVYGLAGRGPWVVPRIGSHPVMADLDGDGVQDLAGARDGGIRTAVRGRPGTFIPLSGTVVDMAAADIDGDGAAELLAVVGGTLHVIDGMTGQVELQQGGDWGEVEVSSPLPGALRVWLLANEMGLVHAFDPVGGALVPAGTFATGLPSWGWSMNLRAIGPGLIYHPGSMLFLLDTRTRIVSYLPVASNDPGLDVQPIPGGFVVADHMQAMAFAWQ